MSTADPREILRAGWFDGELEPLGAGHINLTWRVRAHAGDFVLQRLSPTVFGEPTVVLENVARVLNHLRGSGVPVIETIDSHGNTGYIDADGCGWRLMPFVDGTVREGSLDSLTEAHNAAAAFAAFRSALADLPLPPLAPAIDGFLQFRRYLERLDERVLILDRALTDDEHTLLVAIDDTRELADALPPQRDVIHGDCKANNLIFGSDGRVRAILDLDTVMHGHPAWDWGDLVRSAASSASGELDLDRVRALAAGYAEHASLPREAWRLAPEYLSAMLCVRFLDDHLAGDTYFRVEHAGENLKRAQRQRRLLEQLRSQRAAIDAVLPSG